MKKRGEVEGERIVVRHREESDCSAADAPLGMRFDTIVGRRSSPKICFGPGRCTDLFDWTPLSTMPLSPLALSIERRERHPYRSLYAEMLFQSFRDALAEAGEEASTTLQEFVEGPSSVGSEEERARRHSRRKQHVPDAHLSEGDCAK